MSYGYDAVDRIVEARSEGSGRHYHEAFELDGTGSVLNILGALEQLGKAPSWQVDPGNVLQTRNRTRYEVDASKRRTKKIEKSSDGMDRVTEYVWDCQDRLREVRLPDGRHVRYRYDAFARRVRKTIVPPERTDVAHTLKLAFEAGGMDGIRPLEVTEYLWHDNTMCCELAPNGTRTVHVHEPRTMRPLLQTEGGEVFHVVCDHLGMPKELIDERGRVAWAASHGAYGRIIDEARERTDIHVRSPFRLLGQ